MSFWYASKGISGDLDPRAECAPLWHPQILKNFKNVPLILLIGQYAQREYLKKDCKLNLTETVRCYQEFLPNYFPLPHPSPRNQNWVMINPWFMEEVIPELRKRTNTGACTAECPKIISHETIVKLNQEYLTANIVK